MAIPATINLMRGHVRAHKLLDTASVKEQDIVLQLSRILSPNDKNVTPTNDSLSYQSRNSLVGLNYTVKISVHSSPTLTATYSYKTDELFLITLIAIISFAFLSRFSVSQYFVFAASFAFVFFFANIWFIHAAIRKSIRKLIYFRNELDFEEIARDSDEIICAVCGGTNTIENQKCYKCKTLYKTPDYYHTNMTKYTDSTYTYEPTRKKK